MIILVPHENFKSQKDILSLRDHVYNLSPQLPRSMMLAILLSSPYKSEETFNNFKIVFITHHRLHLFMTYRIEHVNVIL